MNSLEIAIMAAGGVTKLAEKLDVKPNRIHNWRTRGVPDGWLSLIKIKFKRQIATAKKLM
jgi:uncharacterized protein YjcR